MVDGHFLDAARMHTKTKERTEMGYVRCFKRRNLSLPLDFDVADNYIAIFKAK